MKEKYKKTLVVFLMISILMMIRNPQYHVSAEAIDIEYSKSGPYIDTIHSEPLAHEDSVVALESGDVDVIFGWSQNGVMDMLNESENLGIAEHLRNGYGYFSINTAKYPFNITGLRRAMAFALDKKRIADEVWDGLAVPQDSVIPQQNPLSIEHSRDYNYYDSDLVTANSLLDNSGFNDMDGDDFRETPDGKQFQIKIEVAQSSNIAKGCGDVLEENLLAIGLNATCYYVDFYEYLNRLYFHGDFDIVFLGSSFRSFDISWLADLYWSEYADEPYCNFPSWRNATFDSWRNQLLHGCSYEEVQEAAFEMQRVTTYECPEMVIYQNKLITLFRRDRFTNFIVDCVDGVGSWWTLYNVRLTNQSFGGTLRVADNLGVDWFIPICSCGHRHSCMQSIPYDGLLRQDPNGNLIPWLADSYIIQNHDDNPAVPEGNTRFTFDMIENATWTDGQKVTAVDAAFTMNYYREAAYHPYKRVLNQITSAYAINNDTLVIEFAGESYWHIYDIATKPILPKHFFKDINITLWNPDPRYDDIITCGAFYFSDYEPHEFVELTYNPDFFHRVDRSNSTNTLTDNLFDPDLNAALSVGITGISMVVMVVVLVKWRMTQV